MHYMIRQSMNYGNNLVNLIMKKWILKIKEWLVMEDIKLRYQNINSKIKDLQVLFITM